MIEKFKVNIIPLSECWKNKYFHFSLDLVREKHHFFYESQRKIWWIKIDDSLFFQKLIKHRQLSNLISSQFESQVNKELENKKNRPLKFFRSLADWTLQSCSWRKLAHQKTVVTLQSSSSFCLAQPRRLILPPNSELFVIFFSLEFVAAIQYLPWTCVVFFLPPGTLSFRAIRSGRNRWFYGMFFSFFRGKSSFSSAEWFSLRCISLR